MLALSLKFLCQLSFLTIVLFFFSSVTALAQEKEGVSAPKLLSFPLAPKQKQAWTLPEGMADAEGEIEAVVEDLFTLGLADPRDLPYHQMSFQAGLDVKAGRGWLLPEQEGDGEEGKQQRYGIAWNGLVYPLAELGEAADFEADLALLRKQGFITPEFQPRRNYDENPRNVLKPFQTPAWMLNSWAAPYLLLRLGYSVELAETEFPSFFRPSLFDLEEPSYLIFYALRTRDDGVRAFLAGDDQTAAERLFQFDRLWAELLRRVPEEDPEELFPSEFSAPILGSRWREMLLDAKRRLEEAPTKKENLQPVHKRTVQELIESLEDVTWPGFHSWMTKGNPPPEFIQLIQEGKSAIEPLLRCIEEDERWTRIVVHDYKWRSEEEGGLEKGDPQDLLQVRDLAYMALEQVLEFSPLEEFTINWNEPSQERRVRVGELRNFCERYEYQTSGELWYRILADEEASAELQDKAAISIARNAGTRYPKQRGGYDFHYRLDYFWDNYPAYQGSQSLLVGKTLKNKREPSVMELLEKAWRRERARIDELEKDGQSALPSFPVSPGDMSGLIPDRAYLFLYCLEEVEPGHRHLLREHSQWLLQRIERTKNDARYIGGLLDEAEEMLLRRFDGQLYGAKDPEIIADYQELIDFCLKHDFDVPLKLMEVYPKLEGLDAIASKLFLEKEAPYELMGDAKRWYELWELGFGEKDSLLKIPSLRQAVLQALQSEDLVGEVIYAKEGEHQLLIKGVKLYEPEMEGQKHPLRRCDLLAHWLANDYGAIYYWMSSFDLADKEETRDQAIALWIQLLERMENEK